MKRILFFIVALFSCPILAQVPPGTASRPSANSAIDPDLYHDTTGTINLHHKKIWQQNFISYWHAATIIAGNHPTSSTNLDPDPTPDSITMPENYYTSDSCYNDLAYGHSKNFQKDSDGFVIMDAPAVKVLPDSFINDIGAAIFRADDKIILGSGFRVLHNPDPHSLANNIPTDIAGNPTGGNNQDCSYFHAYTGDRFHDLATCSTKVIRLDFTTTPPSALSPFEKIHSSYIGTGCECHRYNNYDYDDAHVDTAYVDSSGNHLLRLYARRKTLCASSGYYSVQDFESGGIQTDRFIDRTYCGEADTLGVTQFRRFHEFGKYEVTAKMAKGRGAWSAIWGYGGTDGNEFNADHTANKDYKYGEIDIIDAGIYGFENGYWRHWWSSECGSYPNNEYTSEDPNDTLKYGLNSTWFPNKTYFMNCGTLAQNIPFIKSQPGRSMYVSYKNPAVNRCDSSGENSFSDCFNKVAYEWLPGEVRFLINDIEVGRTTRYVPNTPLILAITNQISKHNQAPAVDSTNLYHPPGFNELPDSPAVASETLVKTINSDQYDLGAGCKTAASHNPTTAYSSNFSVNLFPANPNPADNFVNIRFTISGITYPVAITLALYDVLGNEIKVLNRDDAVLPGEHTETLFIKGFPSGTYYLRMQYANQVKTEKIVILH